MTAPPEVPFWLQQVGTFLLVASPGLAFPVAYVADNRHRGLRGWVIGALGLAGLGVGLFGLLLALAGALPSLGQGAPMGDLGIGDPDLVFRALFRLGLLTIGLSALSLVLLIPPVRRAIARLVPIDADRLVHLVALDFVLVLIWLSGAIALFMPIVMADPAGMESLRVATKASGLTGVWVQNAAFVMLSVLGVGAFVHRDMRATIERLGLSQPVSVRWWLGGAAATLAIGIATDQIWTVLDPEGAAELGRLSEQLFGPLIAAGGVAAALTIGLAPGIGEELLFRGAAQPRFGLVFTSLMFAAIHTQYTLSWALVQILIVGLILGLVRIRAGTRTAILVHATFNAAQVLLSVYGP